MAALSYCVRACVALLFSFMVIVPTAAAQQKSSEAPSQISEFYKISNFVCAFSTQNERMQIASFFDSETLPEHLKSDRLNRIHRLMKQLNAQIFAADPGINAMRLRSTVPNGASEIVKIIDVYDRGENRLQVKVLVSILKKDKIAKLVSEINDLFRKYGRDNLRVPSFNQDDFSFDRIEYHKWELTSDGWKKSVVNTVLLH